MKDTSDLQLPVHPAPHLDTVRPKLESILQDLQNLAQGDKATHPYLTRITSRAYILSPLAELTARIHAEILRIHAPEAPYTAPQLRNAMRNIITQLKEPMQNINILKSVAEYKSINTIKQCEADGDANIVLDTITTCFEAVSIEHARTITTSFLEILTTLVDEIPVLPIDTVDYIIKQATSNTNQASKSLAQSLLRTSAESLQGSVTQYFSESFKKLLGNDEEEEAIATDKHSYAKLETSLNRLYQSLIELYQLSPSILMNIIPILIKHMSNSDVLIRKSATVAVSKLLRLEGSKFQDEYRACFLEWTERARMDMAAEIRLECTPSIAYIHDVSIAQQILASRLTDTDPLVREAALVVVSDLKENEPVLDRIWQVARERLMDRSAAVRKKALEVFISMWNSTKIVEDKSMQIPGLVVNTTYFVNAETNEHLDQLLPSMLGTSHDSYEKVLGCLDEKAWKGMIGYMGHRCRMRHYMKKFISTWEAYNGGVGLSEEEEKAANKQRSRSCDIVSLEFSNPAAFKANLLKLSANPDPQLYKMLREFMQPRTKISAKTLITRCEGIGANVGETMKAITLRCSWTIGGVTEEALQEQNHVSKFVKNMIETETNYISEQYSQIISTQGERLLDQVQKQSLKKAWWSLHLLAKAQKVLYKDLQQHCSYTDSITIQQYLTDIAVNEEEDGTEASSAACSLICFSRPQSSNESLFTLLDAARKKVLEFESKMEPSNLMIRSMDCIRKITKYHYHVMQTHAEEILRRVETGILDQKTLSRNETAANITWIAFDELDLPTRIYCVALKLYSTLLQAHSLQSVPAEKFNSASAPLQKRLNGIIQSEGQLLSGNMSPVQCSHLRLVAYKAMLRLPIGAGTRFKPPTLYMSNLALAFQDPCFDVRDLFNRSIFVRLLALRLPLTFAAIPLLGAFEPDTALRQRNTSWLRHCHKILNAKSAEENESYMVETCLPFFLCLLAVHPDFSNEPDDLELFEKYINYYFDIYANEKNISLIYHLAGQTKQYKIQDQEISEENLWIVAELALMVIHHRAKERSWVVSPWNGALNPRWFKHMKELPQQQASSVLRQQYINPEYTVNVLHHTSNSHTMASMSQRQEQKDIKPKITKSKPPAVKRKRAPKSSSSPIEKRMSERTSRVQKSMKDASGSESEE